MTDALTAHLKLHSVKDINNFALKVGDKERNTMWRMGSHVQTEQTETFGATLHDLTPYSSKCSLKIVILWQVT